MPSRAEKPPAQPKLARAILEDGRHQRTIARAAGIPEQYIGGVKNGRMEATPRLRSVISRALGRPEHEVFD